MRLLTVVTSIILTTGCVFTFSPAPLASESPTSLADAVKTFNTEAMKDPIGVNEPPLTEVEVVASIRGWDREQIPVTDEVYELFRKITETRQLPKDARLTFTTGWDGHNGYHFNVWWVDLTIPIGDKGGYTFRIRDRKINSRPLTEDECKKIEQDAKCIRQMLKDK
jgi:hypothetical protein